MATHRKVIRPGNQGFSDHRRTGQQLWNAIKNSRVQVQATSAQLAALDKITKLDAADPSHRLRHGLITLGTNGWTSVSTIKKVGTAVQPSSRFRQMWRAAIEKPASSCFCLRAGTSQTAR